MQFFLSLSADFSIRSAGFMSAWPLSSPSTCSPSSLSILCSRYVVPHCPFNIGSPHQADLAFSVSEFEIPPDIYHHHNDFLAHLVVWIQQRLATPSRMQGLACDAVRDANTVFYGIGVYTVMELFFLAGKSSWSSIYKSLRKVFIGLSPFLTSWEVFSNASRTARLCAAFYAYMERSHRDLWYACESSSLISTS